MLDTISKVSAETYSLGLKDKNELSIFDIVRDTATFFEKKGQDLLLKKYLEENNIDPKTTSIIDLR
jgi:hypothetical protein